MNIIREHSIKNLLGLRRKNNLYLNIEMCTKIIVFMQYFKHTHTQHTVIYQQFIENQDESFK